MKWIQHTLARPGSSNVAADAISMSISLDGPLCQVALRSSFRMLSDAIHRNSAEIPLIFDKRAKTVTDDKWNKILTLKFDWVKNEPTIVWEPDANPGIDQEAVLAEYKRLYAFFQPQRQRG